MKMFLSALGYIAIGVVILVAADQVSGMLERARQRKLAASITTTDDEK